MNSVTVVVMAYNEAASLAAVVDEIARSLSRLPAAEHEILIVNDGSDDDTGKLADALSQALPIVRVIHHKPNQGLGGVYRTGFAHARGTYLSFFPADGQFPAEIIENFYASMANQDLILGYIPRDDAGITAKALSLAEKLVYRTLFGAMPRFQGVFMLRREVLQNITLLTHGRGWGVVMEMVLKIHRGGYRVISRQTPFRARMSGYSKVNNVRTIWANLKQAATLRGKLNP